MKNKNRIRKLYKDLLQKHGEPQGQWKLWCKRPKTAPEKEEVIIGAVLGQNTNWNNAEKAILNLKSKSIDSLKKIYALGQKNKNELVRLVKPARFYNQKAEYLWNLSEFIIEKYKNIKKMEKEKTAVLREKLLSLKGLGLETTDSILLYALERPVFVIDEYTKRITKRNKLSKNFSYQLLQKLFENNTPQDFALYQNFHALIVIEEQNLKI